MEGKAMSDRVLKEKAVDEKALPGKSPGNKLMKSKGFTLIELMVVVGIIGIIAAIAYPQYEGYIRDTYQAQAAADLQTCGLALERYFSNGFTYVGADTATVCTLVSPSNASGAGIQYNITYESLTANTYTIKATPSSGSCGGLCIQLTADGTQTNL